MGANLSLSSFLISFQIANKSMYVCFFVNNFMLKKVDVYIKHNEKYPIFPLSSFSSLCLSFLKLPCGALVFHHHRKLSLFCKRSNWWKIITNKDVPHILGSRMYQFSEGKHVGWWKMLIFRITGGFFCVQKLIEFWLRFCWRSLHHISLSLNNFRVSNIGSSKL